MRFEAIDPVARARHVDVYYGNDPRRSCALRIPRVEAYDVDSIPVPPEPDEVPSPEPGAPFPYDLFAALRFWLTDEGHATLPEDAFDVHDRLMAARSAQARHGLLERPVVNAILLHLGVWLAEHVGATPVSPLPDGKRAMVLLSHDVDDPLDPSPLRIMRWVALAVRRGDLRTARGYTRSALKLLRLPGGRHWLFREVLEEETRRGLRSTFFFATTPRMARGASLLDVDYDLRAPRFRGVFEAIAGAGAEVGLHISYNARESHERIAAERAELEEISGVKVAGSRHHYWHMSKPFWRTLADHGRAGLRYDASIAFNEVPGYRLGIAFPFHPFDPTTRAPVSTLQLPAFVMDATLFRGDPTASASPVERAAALLDTLKRHRGVAAIDWHVRTSYPASPVYPGWGETYLAILDLLADDSEIEVGTCADAFARFRGGSEPR